MDNNDLMDIVAVEYISEATLSEKYYETDEVETIAEAIEYARCKGFEISLEEFEGEGYEEPEEAFWEEWLNRCHSIEQRCHPVWGW